MIRHCNGIVCLCLSEEQAARLGLKPMVGNNTSRYGTNFTISIEALHGVTTGISAADRVTTIRVATAPDTTPADLAHPGHVFPLIARRGGVFIRDGHIEGSVDLILLAGLSPQAVLCELMTDEGKMVRRPRSSISRPSTPTPSSPSQTSWSTERVDNKQNTRKGGGFTPPSFIMT